MQIGVYGSGYLATVISACLADFGTPVVLCHHDADRILSMAQGVLPFFEKNLEEVIRRNVKVGRLSYSTDAESFAHKAHTIFLADDVQTDIEELAEKLARFNHHKPTLVIVTPVAIGTATRIEQRLQKAGVKATIVTQPITITDGCAVEDFNWPDRIVLGTTSQEAVHALKQTYHPLVMRGVPVVVTNHETAELLRPAATAFVITKISFINELAALCEHVNADAVSLAVALGLDKRIAPRCLQPGAGIGGMFVEPQMEGLSRMASEKGIALNVLAAAREVNRTVCERVVEKILKALNTLENKQIAVLGLALKPNTSSVAGSSAMGLVRALLAKGARIKAYDPVAIANAKAELNGTVKYCDSPYAAAEGVDALVVSTAWPEFRALDFARIKKLLKTPVIVDAKNLLDPAPLKSMGFRYHGIGRLLNQ